MADIARKTEILVDVKDRHTIVLTVRQDGREVSQRAFPYEGAVDTQLLTAVDNLFHERILDKFASISVLPGSGIDKTSLLYRIVITLDAALQKASNG